LDFAIPEGVASKAQLDEIALAAQHASSKGIQLNVKVTKTFKFWLFIITIGDFTFFHKLVAQVFG